MQPPSPPPIRLARQLIHRLERLSADSAWAHRASGIKGSLLRCLQEWEQYADPETAQDLAPELHNHLLWLTTQGFEILHNAAEEIPAPER